MDWFLDLCYWGALLFYKFFGGVGVACFGNLRGQILLIFFTFILNNF